MSTQHPGFKSVQQSIARRGGMPMKEAGAILAAKSRGALAAAKKKNPRLKRVGGGPSNRDAMGKALGC